MHTPGPAQLEQLVLELSRGPVAAGKLELARRLGVSGDTLERWIRELRNSAVDIVFIPGEGYSLSGAPDLLLPAFIQAQLKASRFGRVVHHRLTANSTNDVAHQLAQQGAEEGTLVVAESQTKGRGRLGRSWFSEPGVGIYASLILRPRMNPQHAAILNLAAAVAVTEAIEQCCQVTPDIKWPNDLLLNGRKCCGILTEMNADPGAIRYVVAGFGINVNHHEFPGALRELATSLLMQCRKRHSRVEILCRLLECFEATYEDLEAGSMPLVIDRWVRRSTYAQGKAVRVDPGGKEILGVTAGLSSTGALRVRLEDGRLEEVVSGDVLAWR